jgi:Putative transmembrane protein (PGPGW)
MVESAPPARSPTCARPPRAGDRRLRSFSYSPGVDRFDLDDDDTVTDEELAAVEPPARWRRFGLRGPAILFRWFLHNAKRMAVLVLGVVVLAAGAAMLVLPGPGVIVLILGLAILATEFAWAERALDRTSDTAAKAMTSLSGSRTGKIGLALGGLGMIAVGVVVLVIVPKYWMASVGLFIAGIVGLATVHPAAQAWLEARQRKTADRKAEADAEAR